MVENVLAPFKGRPESVQALGMTDPSSSTASSGTQVISHQRVIANSNPGTVSLSSNIRENGCFCKVSQKNENKPYKLLLISHWPFLSHMIPLNQSLARGSLSLGPIRTTPEGESGVGWGGAQVSFQ